jgi:hypothetical protein
MTRKLIASNFEIDLSEKKLAVQRDNHWFAEDFFTKFSLPFEIMLTPELDQALGYLSRPNSSNKTTVVECKYYHGNIVEDAILEIEGKSETLTCNLRFGYDQLPSWSKKLSELPLHRFELPEGVSIYEHAETIIPQSYPDVDYNFPQIHTDKIDVENDENYFAFEKIINNRKSGAFLTNEVLEEGGDSVTYNRNIMQPLVHWLYLLKQGFADAGLVLEGEILTDEKLRKKWIFGDVDYATSVAQDSIQEIKMSEDFSETGVISGTPFLVSPFQFNKYLSTLTITNPGRYRIVGKIKLYSIQNYISNAVIKYRNQVIWSSNTPFQLFVGTYTYNVDVVFDTLADLLANTITIESFQRKTEDKIIWDLSINPVRLHDESGEPIPTLINKNEIDLTKAVPDITFGDFVKLNKHWYNYTLDVVGNKAIMNKIQNKIKTHNAVDLSMFEKKTPKIYYQKGISFHMKFADVETKDYKFLEVFHSQEGVKNSSFKTDEKTVSIEINGLPLPLLMRNNVQTAHAFETNASKVYAVIYDGLTAGSNLAQSNNDYLLPVVHETDFKEWFDFQINSEEIHDAFICDASKLLEFTPQSIVWMYGKYHIVKTINDTEVKPGIFDVEYELVSLE